MPALGLALGMSYRPYPGGALLPEVLTYAGNQVTAGSTISAAHLSALNTWALRGTTVGWLSKLTEIWPMMGSTLAGAAVKFRYGAGGQANLDVSRLVSGDYSQANGIGMTTRNASKFIATGFTPSADGLSLNNFSALTTNLDVLLAKSVYAGYMGDTPASGLNKLVWSSNNASSTANPSSNIGSQGNSFFMGVNGPACHVINWGSSSQQVFRNGFQCCYGTATLSDVLDTEINIGRVRVNGTYYVDTFRLGMEAFGTAMTTAEAADFGQASYEFQQAIGRTMLASNTEIFVGDSITSGQSAKTYQQSFQYLIASNRSKTPVCFGNPGALLTQDTSGRKGMYGQRTSLASYPASRVYLMAGTNDGQYDGVLNGNATTIADFKAKMIEMTQLWQSYGHTVILLSLPYSTNANLNATKRAAYALATSEAATATGAGFVDINNLMTNSTSPTPASMMQDTTHPNDVGHLFIANAVAAAYP